MLFATIPIIQVLMKIKNEKREKFNSIIIKFTPDDDDYADGSGAAMVVMVMVMVLLLL